MPGSFKEDNGNGKKITLSWFMSMNMKLQVRNYVFEFGKVRRNIKMILN